MRLTKMTALLLCATLLAVMISGCNDPANPQNDYFWNQQSDSPIPDASAPVDQSTAETSPDAGAVSTGGLDYDAIFAAYSPDTVMIRVDDFTVTWAELFFNIVTTTNSLISGYGALPDLNELTTEGSTYAEAILKYSAENSLMYRAVEYGAKLNGVTFSDEDLASLQSEYDEAISTYGGVEEFSKLLWESDGVSSMELFEYLYSIPYLADMIFQKIYGLDASLLSDEDAALLTASGGYMLAKHILRIKAEDGDDTPVKEIEDILNQLDNYDGDDFGAFFDGLMNEHSEDPGGLASFPDGYLFQYGDMVSEFYDACTALAPGQYSGSVETSYGYHIVYRLPLDYDMIPYYNYSQGDYRSLRQIAASTKFNDTLYEWRDQLAAEYTSEYNSLDLVALLG